MCGERIAASFAGWSCFGLCFFFVFLRRVGDRPGSIIGLYATVQEQIIPFFLFQMCDKRLCSQWWINRKYNGLLLVLFRRSTQNSIAQGERLATSPSCWHGAHIKLTLFILIISFDEWSFWPLENGTVASIYARIGELFLLLQMSVQEYRINEYVASGGLIGKISAAPDKSCYWCCWLSFCFWTVANPCR